MTCREKYVLDNAVKFAEGVDPPGCPDDYGYVKSSVLSDEFGHCIRSCKSCWNVEIPDADKDEDEDEDEDVVGIIVDIIKRLKEMEKEIEKLKAAITKGKD